MSSKSLKSGVACLVSLLSATGLAACGSSDSSSGAPSTSITIALGGEPSSMDPSLVSDGNMDAISPNIYEGLATRDDVMKVVPQLAVSWKQTGSTTWSFQLHSGVKFQDGEPFDAKAAAFSVNRVINPKNNSQNLSYVTTIKSAMATGPLTLQITTKGPDPILPGSLLPAFVPMMPPKYTAAKPESYLSRHPVGTGPYRLTSWTAGQSMVLTRWSGYWGKRPSTSTAHVIWRGDSQSRLAALQSGDAQISQLDPVQSANAPQEFDVPSVDVAELGFDAQPGRLLADKRLREAVNLSIDRSALIKTVFGGHAVPAHGQLVPATTLGYNPSLQDYPYDLDKAKQLVQQAGAEGKQLTFVVEHGRWTNDAQAEDAIAAMIDKTGLKVNVEVLEWSQYLKRIFDRTAEVDLTYFSASSETFNSNRVIATLLLSPKAGGTLGRYTNPKIDSLYAQADSAPTAAGKSAIYQKIWQIAYDNDGVMPLYGQQNIYGAAKNVTFKPRADGGLILSEIA